MKFRSKKNQEGAVLIVALVFMAMTAMISSSVLYTSVMETKMVGNAQFKEEAFQVTEGVIDSILESYETSLPVTGGIGHRICAVGVSSNCDSAVIALPSTVTNVASGVSLTYTAERLAPLFSPFPARLSEEFGSSASAYSVASFEINSTYDGRDAKLGHHDVYQGILIRVAAN